MMGGDGTLHHRLLSRCSCSAPACGSRSAGEKGDGDDEGVDFKKRVFGFGATGGHVERMERCHRNLAAMGWRDGCFSEFRSGGGGSRLAVGHYSSSQLREPLFPRSCSFHPPLPPPHWPALSLPFFLF